MTELLVATTNRGKFAEVESSLKYLPLKILPLPSLGNFPVVIEDGATYEENALKKARTLAEYSGYVTLADDSGLEVDALNGAPGIYSARYSGEEGNDQKTMTSFSLYSSRFQMKNAPRGSFVSWRFVGRSLRA